MENIRISKLGAEFNFFCWTPIGYSVPLSLSLIASFDKLVSIAVDFFLPPFLDEVSLLF